MAKQATMHLMDGRHIPYTAGANIAIGDVVPLVNMIGIAVEAIASGEVGILDTEGVYTLPANASLEINQGDVVYWDVGEAAVNKSDSGNIRAGIAMEHKASSGTTVKVKLNFG